MFKNLIFLENGDKNRNIFEKKILVGKKTWFCGKQKFSY